jgi:hypothetical protein
MPKLNLRKLKSEKNLLAIIHVATIPLVKVLVKTDILPVLKTEPRLP